MQHRMVRQLEVVTSQLDLSNKQRNALQAEVERLEGILADLRHQGP
jgi:polyhydroxyalkanoate synthesis regulator phasin